MRQSIAPRARQIGTHLARRASSSSCCWPECEAPVSGFPLCNTHSMKAYWMVHSTIQAVQEGMAERPTLVDTRTGWVYFVRYRDRVKIGYSIEPQTRIKAHPFDEVLAIVPGERIDEKRAHAAFAHLRENGEWFRAEPELLQFARDIAG